MYEQNPDGSSSREQQLAALLSADFRLPEDPEPMPTDNALAALLRHVQPVEEIDARFESDENAQLGEQVAALLEPAPVTDAFKAVIVHEVRRAHAWQTKVSDTLAPDRLGLLSAPGLFDPDQAQEIETQALRSYMFDVIQHYTARPDSDELPALILKPGTRPRDSFEAIQRLAQWAADFSTTYDVDPLDGIDSEAYLAAAAELHVMSDEEAAEAGGFGAVVFGGLVKRLREIRGEGGSE